MAQLLRQFVCRLAISLVCLSAICAGYETYFPVSTVHMVIPTDPDSLTLLKGTPVYRFQMNHFLNNSKIKASLTKYQLEDDYLESLYINKSTGSIYLMDEFRNKENSSKLTINVKSVANQIKSNRVSFVVTPLPVKSRTDFCEKYQEKVCFWDAVTYSLTETDSIYNMKSESLEIGELSPLIYRKLCPDLELEYVLKNATKYLKIHGNVLRTNENSTIDHESLAPGPLLAAEVHCIVTSLFKTSTYYRTIQINVLDKDDNYPIVHNGDYNKTLTDPHFQMNSPTGISVLFLDNDLVATNRMHCEILDDIYDILSLDVHEYELDHLTSTQSAYNCKLKFSVTKSLRKSPYCVKIRIVDTSYVYPKPANDSEVSVCLKADMSLLDGAFDPTPMALIEQPNAQKPKQKAFLSTVDEVRGNATMILKLSNVILYPANIYIYKTAQNWTRVTEPMNMKELSKTNYRFKILKDPTNSLGITGLGGIVYVRNSSALQELEETLVYLSIQVGRERLNLHLHVQEPINNFCKYDRNVTRIASCSEKRKSSCQKYCGLGVNGGSCEWRQNDLDRLTVKFGTCSPNLTYCPDGFCDPLENLAQHSKAYLCPQDCTRDAFGSVKLNDMMGPGIYSAFKNCFCDAVGKCSCGESDEEEPFIKKDRKQKPKNSTKTKETEDYTSKKAEMDQSKCGVVCMGLIITCPVLIILVITIFLFGYQNNLKKIKKQKLMEHSRSLENADNSSLGLPLMPLNNNFVFKSDPDSKWEFPRPQLILDSTLGEGEFGKVVKGFATDIDNRPGITTVAVKMLKTGAHTVELTALMSEFQLLQEVSHPNVIRLLGACTQGESPLLIIEYCRHGSLRNYLRLSRKIECAGIEFPDGVEPVTVKDILSFAWQICKGMSYLTDNKLVHRDLAARNVLLAEGKVCKVSDFGLTRDVYEDDAYLKRSKDRVPVKWMAPESLADHVYTNRSDVWAFGILAWELITLGASPYPGVPPQNLYHLLKQGYRMEKPENCSEEIFCIVRSCWADDPIGRPSFKVLAGQWETLLGNNAKYLELEQNAISNPLYCADNSKDLPNIETNIDEDKLDHLWYPPNRNSLEMAEQEMNNFNAISRESEKLLQNGNFAPMAYDIPRPLIETKTTEQKLRYENDVIPIQKNSYINDSMTKNQTVTLKIEEEEDASSAYETPISKVMPYMTMKKQDNEPEISPIMPNSNGVYYKTVNKKNKNISNNLDTDNVDKKLSKDLSFKFMNLLNLSNEAAM